MNNDSSSDHVNNFAVTDDPKRSRRGFASMDPEKRREISSKGGKAAHEKGTAHQFSSDEAREAGRKGGLRVSADPKHMAEIGRKGGSAKKAAMDATMVADQPRTTLGEDIQLNDNPSCASGGVRRKGSRQRDSEATAQEATSADRKGTLP